MKATNKSALSIPVMFQKIEDVEDKNNDIRFTKVRIWLMHLGQNFNGSFFEKEVVDKALPTLQYIPIVGFVEDNSLNEKDFSDHRYVLSVNQNGIYKKYRGVAYGVIMSSEDNNAHYEERLCDDGETRTFLVVDGLIWNVFEDAKEIINRDLIKYHSMELWDDEEYYDGYEDENNIFHFTEFLFRASCILGKDFEPGMINSTVEVQFTLKDFVKNMQSELDTKYTTFTKLVEKNKQGGNHKMPKTDFTQTMLEQFDDISAIVSKHEYIVDRWGDNVSRYYLKDVQDNEVIVCDRADNYHIYGLAFSLDGDKPVVDFSTSKRKKTRYEDYVEGSLVPETAFDFGKHIADCTDVAFNKIEAIKSDMKEVEEKLNNSQTEYSQLKDNYDSLKADYDEIKPKFDNYVKAEQAAQEDAIKETKKAIFTKFDTHLSEDKEYVDIKANSDNLTVDEIESQCSILFTKKTLSANTDFNKKTGNSAGLDVILGHDDEEYYVSSRYGNISLNKR